MKRPLAYITAAWSGDPCEATEQAAKYCRTVYEAGFSPICPTLYLPLILNDAIPEEHKDGIDMSRILLCVLVAQTTITQLPTSQRKDAKRRKQNREALWH